MGLHDMRPGEYGSVYDMPFASPQGRHLEDLGFYPGAFIHVLPGDEQSGAIDLELDGRPVRVSQEVAGYVRVIPA